MKMRHAIIISLIWIAISAPLIANAQDNTGSGTPSTANERKYTESETQVGLEAWAEAKELTVRIIELRKNLQIARAV
jgi:hypothetical protein